MSFSSGFSIGESQTPNLKTGEKWVNSVELPITLTKTETIQPSACKTVLECLAELGKSFAEQVIEGKSGITASQPCPAGSVLIPSSATEATPAVCTPSQATTSSPQTPTSTELAELKQLDSKTGILNFSGIQRISQICGKAYGIPWEIPAAQSYAESNWNSSLGPPVPGETSWGLSQISKEHITECLNDLQDQVFKELKTGILASQAVYKPAENLCCYAKLLAKNKCSSLAGKVSHFNRAKLESEQCGWQNNCLFFGSPYRKSTYIDFIASQAQEAQGIPTPLDFKKSFLAALGFQDLTLEQLKGNC